MCYFGWSNFLYESLFGCIYNGAFFLCGPLMLLPIFHPSLNTHWFISFAHVCSVNAVRFLPSAHSSASNRRVENLLEVVGAGQMRNNAGFRDGTDARCRLLFRCVRARASVWGTSGRAGTSGPHRQSAEAFQAIVWASLDGVVPSRFTDWVTFPTFPRVSRQQTWGLNSRF